MIQIAGIRDNGGSQTGRERRKLWLVNYSPERRIVKESRSRPDRQNGSSSREGLAIERRDAYSTSNLGKDRAQIENELQLVGVKYRIN